MNLPATKRKKVVCTVYSADENSPRLKMVEKLIQKYATKLGLTDWTFYVSEADAQTLSGDSGVTVLARMHEALPGLRRASIVVNEEIELDPKDDCGHGSYQMRTFEEVVVHELGHVIMSEAGGDVFWEDSKAFQELEERICDRIAQIATM